MLDNTKYRSAGVIGTWMNTLIFYPFMIKCIKGKQLILPLSLNNLELPPSIQTDELQTLKSQFNEYV